MCTVTYIPTKEGGFITSNRDEDKHRGLTTLPPQWHQHIKEGALSTSIMYPKDSQKGGTWIAVKENGDVIVLLNGALEKHTPKQQYKVSRGLVVIDLLCNQNVIVALQQINLEGIEPFTCIAYSNGTLFEMRWNEKAKTITTLDQTKPYIWSSCTLYNEAVQAQRKTQFNNWLNTLPHISTNAVMQFHKSANYITSIQAGNYNVAENIDTVSITHIYITNRSYKVYYHDLTCDSIAENSFTTKDLVQTI